MTDSLLRRVAFMVELAARKKESGRRLGKTGMQKLLYILQEGFGVPLGYRFDLYTYGPYASALMGDIDYAGWTGLLTVDYEGESGYQIAPGPSAASVDDYRRKAREEAGHLLDELLKRFGQMNAAELELRATVLYIVKDQPSAADGTVIETARNLKPRFADDEIRRALQDLHDGGLVAKVRESACSSTPQAPQ